MDEQNVLNFECLVDPVEMYDGTIAEREDCVIAEDDGKYHYSDDCISLGGKWYLEDSDLIDTCEKCGRTMLAGEHCPDCEVRDYRGEWRWKDDCSREELCGYGYCWITQDELDDWHYCENCNEYVEDDDWDYNNERCFDCADDEASGPIKDYHSHRRSEMKYYGAPAESFCGGGFELEISKNPSSTNPKCSFNQEFARDLAPSCGLEEGEIFYETDRSIGTGFEIISAPHTVKDFWNKQKAWADMLDACSSAGFKSHDAGCCGLHVHVSRKMFGPKGRQDINIAKVGRLYTLRWDDFLKASRRRNLEYCHKVKFPIVRADGVKERDATGDDKAKEFKKVMNRYASGHGMALNDLNTATFEYRLGRGTLNKVSFFAWIDLCFTITKNSRKKEDLLFSDQTEWLDGIREQTAKYLYNRGAFVPEVLKLFPQLEWESSVVDQEIA